MGNRHTLPRPTAQPAEIKIKPNLDDNLSLDFILSTHLSIVHCINCENDCQRFTEKSKIIIFILFVIVSLNLHKIIVI